VAVIGPVMLAALLEWFLWLAAFLYCLYKVYMKADHWSIRVLAVLLIIAFTILRYGLASSHFQSTSISAA
jgi:chitin synthase